MSLGGAELSEIAADLRKYAKRSLPLRALAMNSAASVLEGLAAPERSGPLSKLTEYLVAIADQADLSSSDEGAIRKAATQLEAMQAALANVEATLKRTDMTERGRLAVIEQFVTAQASLDRQGK